MATSTRASERRKGGPMSNVPARAAPAVLSASAEPASAGRLTGRLLPPTAGGVNGVRVVGLVVLTALFAPVLAPRDANDTDITRRLRPPAWLGGEPGYWLGTDALGRDLLSRIIFGTRISLTVSLGATL